MFGSAFRIKMFSLCLGLIIAGFAGMAEDQTESSAFGPGNRWFPGKAIVLRGRARRAGELPRQQWGHRHSSHSSSSCAGESSSCSGMSSSCSGDYSSSCAGASSSCAGGYSYLPVAVNSQACCPNCNTATSIACPDCPTNGTCPCNCPDCTCNKASNTGVMAPAPPEAPQATAPAPPAEINAASSEDKTAKVMLTGYLQSPTLLTGYLTPPDPSNRDGTLLASR